MNHFNYDKVVEWLKATLQQLNRYINITNAKDRRLEMIYIRKEEYI